MGRAKYSLSPKKGIQNTNILRASNVKTPSKVKHHLLTSLNVNKCLTYVLIKNLSLVVCEHQRRRLACAYAQSGQRLCYSLIVKRIRQITLSSSINILHSNK